MKKILITLLIFTFFSIITIYMYFSKVTGKIEEAESAFENYIEAQGVNEDNIKTKDMYKNYKFGGYDITVTYKDEPSSYVYEYFYNAKTKKINLIVLDDGRSIEEGMKYPPIKE
ncbi:DUF3139 domain-containing protein [Lysinibacillus sp. fkY74-1]